MSQRTTLRDDWGNIAMTISVKAIVLDGGKIWLRKNERNDWELPGGRLDEGEQPEETIAREIQEELGMKLASLQLVDVYIWKKEFGTSSHIAIVTFSGVPRSKSGIFEKKGEAGEAEFGSFTITEALALKNLPEVYKRAIRKLE